MSDEIEAEHEYNFNADLPLLEKLNTKHVADATGRDTDDAGGVRSEPAGESETQEEASPELCA